ncbi:uncharacterized protein BX664DRAFT_337005 [Halteromyces radiatus]|uniref:uncharacterized protein n=1 Tax=Halteromyces radiatus TaxID=101107 RepID=UPI00221E7BE5|nr:uncharacterized protein BX664DRAFT_337005 [Halteromyces radiatus]KAI8084444.1 hypothetical protein BX664DRAFT_337005 [Halteromyces radiatus]
MSTTILDSWNTATPFSPPVPVALCPLLAYFCITGGLASSGLFVVQGKHTRLLNQFQTAFLAAILLGFGAIFTSISIGIFV